MREIKFRAIPLFGKDFVYGSLIIEKNEKGEDTYTIRRYENGKISYFEVKKETVGQYTGLKDKNGVEIYESDICLIENCFVDFKDKLYNHIGEVKYMGCRFIVIDEYLNMLNPFEYKNNIEVIGSIYKNKELLGQEK